ncbi:hypothetical protein RIF23_02320 [Lipingzhangella sp. LS1_29]|uniref:Uncharacterized protein n=1 Tax=Lipingzhangella rawalii TaxID=2055835 RepID=A0ABU2H1D4_9ACTN|nr:hypothetical protein [Lipingzhangella rawalii]MDS1269127.1 hypothetical protein [Lipingzhangella rawalii]
MTDAFRTAVLGLIDAAESQDTHRFATHVRDSFELAGQVDAQAREDAIARIGPVIANPGILPGDAADLAIVAGAMVDTGARAGSVGLLVLRSLASTAQAATRFVEAWEQTGDGPLIEPEALTTADEERVATVLGTTAGSATMAWWTARRFAAAGVSMLGDTEVRSHLAAEPDLHAELYGGAQRLAHALPEFAQLRSLLDNVDVPADSAPPSPPPAPQPPQPPPAPAPSAAPSSPPPPGRGLVPPPPASACVTAQWGTTWRYAASTQPPPQT